MGLFTDFGNDLSDKVIDHGTLIGGGAATGPVAAVCTFAERVPEWAIEAAVILLLILLRFAIMECWHCHKQHRELKRLARKPVAAHPKGVH